MIDSVEIGVEDCIQPSDLTAPQEIAELAVSQAGGAEYGFAFFPALKNAGKIAPGVDFFEPRNPVD